MTHVLEQLAVRLGFLTTHLGIFPHVLSNKMLGGPMLYFFGEHWILTSLGNISLTFTCREVTHPTIIGSTSFPLFYNKARSVPGMVGHGNLCICFFFLHLMERERGYGLRVNMCQLLPFPLSIGALCFFLLSRGSFVFHGW